MAGLAENITNSVKLKLELGLSLAKRSSKHFDEAQFYKEVKKTQFEVSI